MTRIRNSLALARSSWAVLKADKELLLLPVISGIASLIVAASFVIPIFVAGNFGGASLVVLAVMYFVLAYITIFFNAALISAADERLQGGDPTVGSAIRGAARRAGKILPWALLSAVVSVILRAIEERVGFVGKIVISLVGMVWSVITFLVLPIIVIEGTGAGKALKKSGTLVRNTWGENLAGHIGLSILGFLPLPPGDSPGGNRNSGRCRSGRRGHRGGRTLGNSRCRGDGRPERDLPDGPLPLCRGRTSPIGVLRQPGDAGRLPSPAYRPPKVAVGLSTSAVTAPPAFIAVAVAARWRGGAEPAATGHRIAYVGREW